MAITPPTNWDTLWNNTETDMLIKLSVYTRNSSYRVFTEADLMSCAIEASLGSDLSIGNVTSQHLSFVLSGGASLINYFEQENEILLSVALSDGEVTTNYVSRGKFYVDSAIVVNDVDLSVSAYDLVYFYVDSTLGKLNSLSTANTLNGYLSMCRSTTAGLVSKYGHMKYFNTIWFQQLLNTTIKYAFPYGSSTSSTITVGNDIHIDRNLFVQLTFGQILSSFATIAGGNIVVDANGYFQLMPLKCGYENMARRIDDGISAEALTVNERTPAMRASLNLTGSQQYSYGFCIDANISDKIQVRSTSSNVDFDRIYENYRNKLNILGKTFADISASNAFVSPLTELNDLVYVNTIEKAIAFSIGFYRLDLCEGCWGDIGCSVSQDAVKWFDNPNAVWYEDTNIVFEPMKPFFKVYDDHHIMLYGLYSERVNYIRGIMRLGSSSEATRIDELSISYKLNGTQYTFSTRAWVMNDYVFPTGSTNASISMTYETQTAIPSAIVNGTATNVSVLTRFKNNAPDSSGLDLNLEYLHLTVVENKKNKAIVEDDLIASHESDTDDWTALTLNSAAKPYGSTSEFRPVYKKFGDAVTIQGEVSPKNTIEAGGTLDICTLPEEIRPHMRIRQLCQGSTRSKWLLSIDTDGNVTASRYSTGGTAVEMTSSNWLPFTVTYLI